MKNKLYGFGNALLEFLENLNELQIQQIKRLSVSDNPDEIAAIRYQMMMSSIVSPDY